MVLVPFEDSANSTERHAKRKPSGQMSLDSGGWSLFWCVGEACIKFCKCEVLNMGPINELHDNFWMSEGMEKLKKPPHICTARYCLELHCDSVQKGTPTQWKNRFVTNRTWHHVLV